MLVIAMQLPYAPQDHMSSCVPAGQDAAQAHKSTREHAGEISQHLCKKRKTRPWPFLCVLMILVQCSTQVSLLSHARSISL